MRVGDTGVVDSGVTALDGLEAGLVPAWLRATTVKVYEIVSLRPVTTQLNVVVVQLRPEGCDVATYEVMAEPPCERGAVHETVAEAEPAEAVTERGADGTAVFEPVRSTATSTATMITMSPSPTRAGRIQAGRFMAFTFRVSLSRPVYTPRPPHATYGAGGGSPLAIEAWRGGPSVSAAISAATNMPTPAMTRACSRPLRNAEYAASMT